MVIVILVIVNGLEGADDVLEQADDVGGYGHG